MIRKWPERAPKAPSLEIALQLGPDRVAAPAPTLTTAPERPPKSSSAPPRVEPLAPSRYKVQFTASGELREKLGRLQELMQAELAEVIEAAVTEKIERLEGRKYAQTKTPRKSLEQTDTSPKSRYVPAAVKRAVRKRDGGQCRFVSEQGRRCTERRGLELHHHDPFGRGGDHCPDNLSLMCHTQRVSRGARLRQRRVREIPEERRPRVRDAPRLRSPRRVFCT